MVCVRVCIVCVRVPVHACVPVALRRAHLNKILRCKNTLLLFRKRLIRADIKNKNKKLLVTYTHRKCGCAHRQSSVLKMIFDFCSRSLLFSPSLSVCLLAQLRKGALKPHYFAYYYNYYYYYSLKRGNSVWGVGGGGWGGAGAGGGGGVADGHKGKLFEFELLNPTK